MAKDAPGVSITFAPHDEDEKKVGIKKTGCQGVCELEPLVRIQKGDRGHPVHKGAAGGLRRDLERTVLGDEVLEHLLPRRRERAMKDRMIFRLLQKQTCIVLKNWWQI